MLFSTLVICQNGSKKPQDNRYEVILKLNNGKEVVGVTEYYFDYPWKSQKSLSVFSSELLNQKVVKNKERTTYKAKDIKSFTLNDRHFVSKKVTLASATGGASMKMMPKYHLVEEIVSGDISVYRGFMQMPLVNPSIEHEEESRNNPEYFVEKDGKVRNAAMVNMEKLIVDAEITYGKYMRGEFGNEPRGKSKKKLMGKLMSAAKKANEKNGSRLLLKVVHSYNEEITE